MINIISNYFVVGYNNYSDYNNTCLDVANSLCYDDYAMIVMDLLYALHLPLQFTLLLDVLPLHR